MAGSLRAFPAGEAAGATNLAILDLVRVAILTAGSRGDVAPFTGLGRGLVRAGHDVTLVTHGCFSDLVPGSGWGSTRCPSIRGPNWSPGEGGGSTGVPRAPGRSSGWQEWPGRSSGG